MKIGLGIRGQDRTNPSFLYYAAQIGVTDTIVFMPDKNILPSAQSLGYWSVEDLTALRDMYHRHNLEIDGFENFDPRVWYKILLDEPGKQQQMDNLKRCIENMGKAGIKKMGYNFSIACVTGQHGGNFARGGARTVRFTQTREDVETPFPLGWAWNHQVVDNPPEGTLDFISREQMWERRDYFLRQIIPVAEEAGVVLAAHPEDPPIPVLRAASRLLIRPADFDELLSAYPSDSIGVEFCQGTFAEMGVDVYDTIRHFGSRGKISYVHFRNVKGTVPEYTEVFIDEGDTDMVKAIKTYHECGYEGLLMPDHVPTISCANPTETGMAHAIGYIAGIMRALNVPICPSYKER